MSSRRSPTSVARRRRPVSGLNARLAAAETLGKRRPPPAYPQRTRVRIDRIEVDIPGWSALSGRYEFPRSGVAFWSGPNGVGKSMVLSLVGAAFYGIPSEARDLPPSGWLTLRCTLDNGEELAVTRDLGTGALQVTDRAKKDVTDRWSKDAGLGEALLGFTRAQFLTVARIGLDDLGSTIAHPTLRALLTHGRGPAAVPTDVAAIEPSPGASTPPAATASPGAVRSPSPAEHTAEDEEEDMAAEMGWIASSSFAPSERVLTLDGSDGPPAGPEGPAASPDDPVSRLRALRRELDRANEELDERGRHYGQVRERLAELEKERDRLGGLEGAEPGDVERLQELVLSLQKTGQKRDHVRVRETRFHEDLATRSIRIDELEPIDALFRKMPVDALRFLDKRRQSETVLRGNQALTRSESRLEESRLQEIQRERDHAAKAAILPLLLSMAGLFGSVTLPHIPAVPVSATVLLAAGLACAAVGAALLWRAHRIRWNEHRTLAEALARKKDQMARFEREATHASARLEEMAAAAGLVDGEALVRYYATWQQSFDVLEEQQKYRRELETIEREAAELRDKLASFTAPVSDTDVPETEVDLDAVVNDYLRYFSMGDEVTAMEARVAEVEESLAQGEADVAEKRSEIAALLEAEGVDSSGNLDEAIETVAMRAAGPSGMPTPFPPPPPLPPRSSAAPEEEARPAAVEARPHATGGWREIDPDALSLDGASRDGAGSAEWGPALSARMEAILRRWVPAARAIDVDGALVPHLKLDPAGPTISGPDFDGCGSALRDHVCLALRLAIVETLSSAGERIPVFLDDPFVRSDDARHDLAIRFLVEDASRRGQVVYLTSQEVRIQWFQQQHPQLAARLVPMRPVGATPAAPAAPAAAEDANEAAEAWTRSSSSFPFSSDT